MIAYLIVEQMMTIQMTTIFPMARDAKQTQQRRRFSALKPIVTAILIATAAQQVSAQTSSAPPQPGTASTSPVTSIVVVGNPLGGDARDLALPVTVLMGDELLRRRGNTLGETLNGQLGVSSTWFGPNAGRPVIRGLDGDRVRVLSNLSASFDASSLSYDHNPSVDPLAIERVEVLRGAAALLYGGTAIGGVVNVIDNRIPAAPLQGVRAAVETRAGGADRERSTSVLFEAGNGVATLHLDAFNRNTENYRVPATTGVRSPVVNSAADARGGAVGGAVGYAGGRGNVGISHARYETNYGTVAEEAVRIDMKQNRTAAEWSLRDIGGMVESFFVKAGRTDYQHVELEDGEVATRFKNDGRDLRAEFRHARIGALQGVLGIQGESFTFSALGDEAFVPKTSTRNRALFLYEEMVHGAWRFNLGARTEQSRVASDGAGSDAAARFGAASRRNFSLASGSVGASYRVSPSFSVNTNLALNSRAPTYYELFADGPHIATAAYEVGNQSFGVEKATALDANIKWVHKDASLQLGVFVQRFRNFIALRRTGIDRDTEGNANVSDCGDGTSTESGCTAEILPEYRYQAVNAQLHGLEVQGSWPLITKPFKLAITGKLDIVRAQDRSNREPLPRIAPMRSVLGLAFAHQGWKLDLDVEHAAKQNRVPSLDLLGETRSYTLLNAHAAYRFRFGGGSDASVFLRATNLTDKRAFNASSIDTVRNLAPLPGRSVKLGLRLDF